MSEQTELAPRWRRLLATGIDMILVPALTILLVMITDVAENAEDYTSNLWMLWVLLLAVLSYLLLNGVPLWRRGQTLGKMALGVCIVQAGTSQLAPWWKLICIRALFFPLLFVLLPPYVLIPIVDQIMILFRSRRCLHDYLSGTEVILRTPQLS